MPFRAYLFYKSSISKHIFVVDRRKLKKKSVWKKNRNVLRNWKATSRICCVKWILITNYRGRKSRWRSKTRKSFLLSIQKAKERKLTRYFVGFSFGSGCFRCMCLRRISSTRWKSRAVTIIPGRRNRRSRKRTRSTSRRATAIRRERRWRSRSIGRGALRRSRRRARKSTARRSRRRSTKERVRLWVISVFYFITKTNYIYCHSSLVVLRAAISFVLVRFLRERYDCPPRATFLISYGRAREGWRAAPSLRKPYLPTDFLIYKTHLFCKICCYGEGERLG